MEKEQNTNTTTNQDNKIHRRRDGGLKKKKGKKGRASHFYNKPNWRNKEYMEIAKRADPVCTSQIYSPLYEKLEKEGRLRRFRAAIKKCSSEGLDINDMCKRIYSLFPDYITKKDFNPHVFQDMCRFYGDIAEAWGYGVSGDEITKQMIKDRAEELAISATSLTEIETYNRIYDAGIKTEEDKETMGGRSTIFHFNLTNKQED